MNKIATFLLFVFVWQSCQSDPVKGFQDKLTQLDQEMGGAAVNDKAKAVEFIQVSEQLAEKVRATNTDQYVDVLLKAAGLAKTIGQAGKALELYSRIAEGLPDHKKAPTALFMVGFVQENDLGDLDKAKATYEAFLAKYPNDPDFADDARNALAHFGQISRRIDQGV
jgi:Uncharacterized protein conserved in bacteria